MTSKKEATAEDAPPVNTEAKTKEIAIEKEVITVEPISTKDLLMKESKNVANVNPTRVNFAAKREKEIEKKAESDAPEPATPILTDKEEIASTNNKESDTETKEK